MVLSRRAPPSVSLRPSTWGSAIWICRIQKLSFSSIRTAGPRHITAIHRALVRVSVPNAYLELARTAPGHMDRRPLTPVRARSERRPMRAGPAIAGAVAAGLVAAGSAHATPPTDFY